MDEKRYQDELTLIRNDIDKAKAAIRVEVVWRDVAANVAPFQTFEAAQNWLSLWLRPDLDAVYYDETGHQLALPRA